MDQFNKIPKYTHLEIIKRKCCQTVYAACAVGKQFQDKEWKKSIYEAKQNGDLIETIEAGKGLQFSPCICNDYDPNQLNLFS